jgi:hypothetical protein
VELPVVQLSEVEKIFSFEKISFGSALKAKPYFLANLPPFARLGQTVVNFEKDDLW